MFTGVYVCGAGAGGEFLRRGGAAVRKPRGTESTPHSGGQVTAHTEACLRARRVNVMSLVRHVRDSFDFVMIRRGVPVTNAVIVLFML